METTAHDLERIAHDMTRSALIESSCDPELQACRRDLVALLNLAQELRSEASSAALLHKALEQAAHVLDFEAGLVWQASPGTTNFRLANTIAVPPPLLAATPVELGSAVGASGRALAGREPVLMSIEEWSGPEPLRDALRAAEVRTLLGIPLLAHGHVMGVMVLVTTDHRGSHTVNRDLAATLGAVVGVALLHAQEHAALIQEERLAALGEMTAGVIHELKSPLTVLLARLRLLQLRAETHRSLTVDEITRSIEALDEAAQRMKGIVDSLSLYSKPPKAKAQVLAVAPLFTAITEMLTFSARAASVRLSAEPPVPGDLRLLGDRSHLVQVLLNLGTNALEAADPGGTVTLSARRGAGAQVVLEVADTGPGIPQEVQARIWEPFFTTKAEGTGLGLAIVRSLVEEMGGTIQVESGSGRGTVFRVSVPEAPRFRVVQVRRAS